MPLKKIKALLLALPLCLFISGLSVPAAAGISKTSKRVIRPSFAPALTASDFSAAALSTSSLQWSWSTGPFTGSGITGYHLYSSSTGAIIDLTPETSYYIDAGLGANRQFTRWLTAYDGTGQGSDSNHIEKYTYASPPDTISVPVSSINATNAYVTWRFSTATAYAIETSSDAGVSYFRNREAFVPWQTIQLLSNTAYLIRLGAVNGDDELTPGLYSAVNSITTYPLDPELTAVAVSSYQIKWQWSTGTFTGTGITGYRIYKSSVSEADSPASYYENVLLAQDLAGDETNSWTEVFIDTDTASADSRHSRWLRAVGLLLSEKLEAVQRYTYAIAPASCTASYPEASPYLHVYQNSIDLNWDIGWSTSALTRNGVASSYVIEYSTAADFTLSFASAPAPGAPATLAPITENTKYDLRIGAINGDAIQTPVNAENPFAYSGIYRAITQPAPPSVFSCSPLTDTALDCHWSTTTTTVNPSYISGYGIGEYKYGGDYWFWDPLNYVAGAASNEDRLDYFLTNSSHTVTMYTYQTDPDFIPVHGSDPAWYYHGYYESTYVSTEAATFATPPNDVVFDTVAARSVGMWWKEPEVPATQYFVQRSTNTGEKGPWVFVSSVTGWRYNDTGPFPGGLTPSTTYSYRIGAINLLGRQTIGLAAATDGNRRDYSFVRSTITKHIAPVLSGIGASTTSITWSWTDTVPGVTSYNIYTATGGLITTLSFPAASYTEVNLSSANARYTRRVRSVAPDGEGDYSEASASTLTDPPDAAVITSSGMHSLSLGWTANGSARYKIDRSTDGVSWTGVKAWSDVFVSTSFIDTHLRFATTYYYAVSGYNDDQIVSVSSALTASNMTFPLPSTYTVVFATCSASMTAPLPAPSLAQLTVYIPTGTPDGYFTVSTNATASPVAISKSSLDAATSKLRNAVLLPGSIVELHLYDAYGDLSNPAVPAVITVTYTDADDNGIVDGTTPQASTGTLNLFNLDTSALVWNRQTSAVSAGAKSVYSDSDRFSFYALGSLSGASVFSAAALSTSSIQWSWPTVAGVDGYRLYSSSTSAFVVLSSSASYYIDTGLGANKPYTRWLRTFTGAVEGSESAHIQKYTYALPPDTIVLSTLTAESVYVSWYFSTATAYAIECSTNGGTDYVLNREAFVPWQTIPLLSNKNYLIRLGAINGDHELTPGLYSSVQIATTPPLDLLITGVAVSSYTIQWNWSTAIAATGITGYRIYRSTSSEAAGPAAGETGEVVYSTTSVEISSWTETFADGAEPAANSQHARWIKAVGILESPGRTVLKKYTYAVAPSSCGLVSPGFLNVFTDSVNLDWEPRTGPSEASKYVIDYATAGVAESSADFNVALTSAIVAGAPASVTGLAWDTKHDFRIGAINGDNEQTPVNALNPYAYSARYKVITKLIIPDHSCEALTDTSLKWSWSTGTYTNMAYITGYGFGILRNTPEWGDYWERLDYIPGVASNEYDYNPPAPYLVPDPYLLTNSTHTRGLWAYQSWTPSCFDSPSDPACYNFYGSNATGATCATFATPPNDVVFDTVAARSIGMWWKEPEIPATQYQVERSTTTGEDGPWVFLSSVTGTHYNDTGVDLSTSGLTPSKIYSYRIGAINQLGVLTSGLSAATGGNRRDYSFVSSTVTTHIAPVLYGVATGTTSINWFWTDLLPGVTVQSYNLYTSSGGIIASGLSAATSYYLEVNLSSANGRYTRWVRSVASDGEGDYSEKAVSTWANPPAAPVITSSGTHTLSVGWSANGSASYKLDRSPDRNAWTLVGDAFTPVSFNDTHLHFSATYYYAVRGYNDDGIVSVSSAITAANMTLPLPSTYTVVYATAAVVQTASATLSGLGLTIAVEIPAGTPDSYFGISTSAAVTPIEITKANLDLARDKLLNATLLSVVELHLYDAQGYPMTGNLASPARVTITYTDANNDDIVDGTPPLYQATSLRLFNLDTSALVWNQIANSMLNKGARTVYADVAHFSFYALGSITSAAGTIADVFAYPNPYRPGSSGIFGQSLYGPGIVFQSLPAKSNIKIFNLAGGLVKELSDDDGDGRCLWDARNSDGALAASGTYLYLVSSPAGGKKSGRIAIIK